MTETEPRVTEAKPKTVRIHAVVTGVVQGVGFRYFAVTEARKQHIYGWVRNCFDGSVEAEAQGSTDAVATFIQALNAGPSWSHVDNVALTEIPVERHGTSTAHQRFEVRADAD